MIFDGLGGRRSKDSSWQATRDIRPIQIWSGTIYLRTVPWVKIRTMGQWARVY